MLDYIRTNNEVTRGEIASNVGLTVQTVSTIVRELEELGYLIPVRNKPSGRGLPPTSLRLNPNGGFTIGVSVTPIGIDAALMNLAGDIIGSAAAKAVQPSPEQALTLIAQLIAQMRALCEGKRILGVGLAMPGPFDVQSMSFVGPTTLQGWSGFPVQQKLAEIAQMPGFVALDTVAAALGVRLYGEGVGLSHFYYLHLGVGLGGVMVQDGQPLRGAWGNAGEIGHIPAVQDGLPCPCGNKGCLERYLSLDSFNKRPPGQSLGEWVERVTPSFHQAVRTIENLFDPETIVLGGIAPAELIEALAATNSQLSSSVSCRPNRKSLRITASTAHQSVLRGAAALAVSGVLSPHEHHTMSPDRVRKRNPFSNGIAA